MRILLLVRSGGQPSTHCPVPFNLGPQFLAQRFHPPGREGMLSFWSETLQEPASLVKGVRGHVPRLRGGGLASEMVSPFQVRTPCLTRAQGQEHGSQAEEPELAAVRPRGRDYHTPGQCDIVLSPRTFNAWAGTTCAFNDDPAGKGIRHFLGPPSPSTALSLAVRGAGVGGGRAPFQKAH